MNGSQTRGKDASLSVAQFPQSYLLADCRRDFSASRVAAKGASDPQSRYEARGSSSLAHGLPTRYKTSEMLEAPNLGNQLPTRAASWMDVALGTTATGGVLMRLEIRRGIAKKRQREVREPMFLVGAASDCDMVLSDQQFAPIHFYLLRRDDLTLLRCVGQLPELSVNGQVRKSVVLHEGDRIRTGPYEFLCKAG